MLTELVAEAGQAPLAEDGPPREEAVSLEPTEGGMRERELARDAAESRIASGRYDEGGSGRDSSAERDCDLILQRDIMLFSGRRHPKTASLRSPRANSTIENLLFWRRKVRLLPASAKCIWRS